MELTSAQSKAITHLTYEKIKINEDCNETIHINYIDRNDLRMLFLKHQLGKLMMMKMLEDSTIIQFFSSLSVLVDYFNCGEHKKECRENFNKLQRALLTNHYYHISESLHTLNRMCDEHSKTLLKHIGDIDKINADIEEYSPINSKLKTKIRDIALDSGFKLKPQENGNMDLNSYVYTFAKNIIKLIKK